MNEVEVIEVVLGLILVSGSFFTIQAFRKEANGGGTNKNNENTDSTDINNELIFEIMSDSKFKIQDSISSARIHFSLNRVQIKIMKAQPNTND